MQDTCGAPLCETGGGVYGSSSADFTCYYSQLTGSQYCNYPLTSDSNYNLFCTYDSVSPTSPLPGLSCPSLQTKN